MSKYARIGLSVLILSLFLYLAGSSCYSIYKESKIRFCKGNTSLNIFKESHYRKEKGLPFFFKNQRFIENKNSITMTNLNEIRPMLKEIKFYCTTDSELDLYYLSDGTELEIHYYLSGKNTYSKLINNGVMDYISLKEAYKKLKQDDVLNDFKETFYGIKIDSLADD